MKNEPMTFSLGAVTVASFAVLGAALYNAYNRNWLAAIFFLLLQPEFKELSQFLMDRAVERAKERAEERDRKYWLARGMVEQWICGRCVDYYKKIVVFDDHAELYKSKGSCYRCGVQGRMRVVYADTEGLARAESKAVEEEHARLEKRIATLKLLGNGRYSAAKLIADEFGLTMEEVIDKLKEQG